MEAQVLYGRQLALSANDSTCWHADTASHAG